MGWTIGRAAVLAAALGAMASSVPAQAAQPPAPRKPVDLKAFYTGTWHEIGRKPMKVTDGCGAGTTSYQVRTPTTIAVTDTCRQGSPTTGKLRAIMAHGTIRDPGTNAILHLSYKIAHAIPVWDIDFEILDHDDGYSWFLASDQKFDNFWIYTRAERPDPALIEQLKGEARQMGYDPARLEFPPQP